MRPMTDRREEDQRPREASVIACSTMSGSIRAVVIASAFASLVACKFEELPPLDEDGATDAPVSDAPPSDAAVDAIPNDGRPVQFVVTVTVDPAGTGAGTVQIEPGGFTCVSGTCMRSYDAGSNLTITATGNGTLDGVGSISGDCQMSPCELTNLGGDRSVTARFVRYQCVPSTETCAAGVYNQCDATGNFISHVIPNGALDGTSTTIVMQNYTCPMGCHATQPRCADVALGNGVEAALDTTDVSPTGRDIVLPGPGAPGGTILVNTGTFNETAGTIQLTDTDGAGVLVPAQLVTQPIAPKLLVLKVRTFTLRSGSVLRAYGPHGLAIASNFDIRIGGTMDLSAEPASGNSVGGAGSVSGTSASTCLGGAVGGNVATGGGGARCAGGAASASAPGGLATTQTSPFVAGGCTGGNNGLLGGRGGYAGGALLLASRTTVTLDSASLLDVSGGGGRANDPTNGNYATGGGSGGAIIVQAPAVRLNAGVAIAGRGGSGAAASTSTFAFGSEGPVNGTIGAVGATCAGCGTGGAGGYEGSCNGGNAAGSSTALGGGGGSVGTCRIYTRAGSVSVPAGTMRIDYAPRTLQPRSP